MKMSIWKHIRWALQYGDWDAGWDSTWGTKPGEPFFLCKPMYYDGFHCYVRIGKLWFGVSY